MHRLPHFFPPSPYQKNKKKNKALNLLFKSPDFGRKEINNNN